MCVWVNACSCAQQQQRQKTTYRDHRISVNLQPVRDVPVVITVLVHRWQSHVECGALLATAHRRCGRRRYCRSRPASAHVRATLRSRRTMLAHRHGGRRALGADRHSATGRCVAAEARNGRTQVGRPAAPRSSADTGRSRHGQTATTGRMPFVDIIERITEAGAAAAGADGIAALGRDGRMIGMIGGEQQGWMLGAVHVRVVAASWRLLL